MSDDLTPIEKLISSAINRRMTNDAIVFALHICMEKLEIDEVEITQELFQRHQQKPTCLMVEVTKNNTITVKELPDPEHENYKPEKTNVTPLFKD